MRHDGVMRILDSHLHLWDPAVLTYDWLDGALNSPYGADEVARAAVTDAAAEAFVFVQAQCAPEQYVDEVRWVTGLAERVGVRAIVAGARLDRGEATVTQLDALGAHDLVVGVRHLLQPEPDGVAQTAEFLAGAREVAARGWTFDACVSATQLPDVIVLAGAVPTLRMVLDHLGKPAVGTAGGPVAPTEEWASDIAALAQHPQVYCKLSGIPAEAGGNWSAAQMEPFLDVVLAAFGPERLMWGSDWPVSAVDFTADAYRVSDRTRWAHTVAAWAERRGLDVDPILWGNAVRFYGI